MTIPEQYDGMVYGYVDWGPILEEMGRGLVASPYFSTAVLGATAVQLCGRNEQEGIDLARDCVWGASNGVRFRRRKPPRPRNYRSES